MQTATSNNEMPAEPMIGLLGIAKAFHGRMALRPLTLEIARGELFGLLGHNGAGKSTTIGILLGQIHPDAGRALIGGVDVARDRSRALSRLGAIFEAPAFYDYLSGWKNLEIFTAFSRRVPEAQMREAVAWVGLTGQIGHAVRTYSHGMRQRLALAQALLPRPEILILDEPTEGLDPEGILEMRNLILDLNRRHGITILLCSHLLTEVEQLCPRVAILQQGEMIFCGPWRQPEIRRFSLETDRPAEAFALLERLGLAQATGPGEGKLLGEAGMPEIAENLVRHGHRIELLAPIKFRLEDVYLQAAQGNREEA
jgi:ABC-2 type transport system ATP-binding protein